MTENLTTKNRIEELLSYDNPLLNEYKAKQLIPAKSNTYKGQYSDFVFPGNVTKEDIEKASNLEKYLNGNTLIDLGAGLETGYLLLEVKNLRPSEYIAVDRIYKTVSEHGYDYEDLKRLEKKDMSLENIDLQNYKEPLENKKVIQPMKSEFPIIYSNNDMLNFVARLASESVNIHISGIDEAIIRDPVYQQALCEEIIRVVKPGGIIFGVQSVVLSLMRQKILSGELQNFTIPNNFLNSLANVGIGTKWLDKPREGLFLKKS